MWTAIEAWAGCPRTGQAGPFAIHKPGFLEEPGVAACYIYAAQRQKFRTPPTKHASIRSLFPLSSLSAGRDFLSFFWLRSQGSASDVDDCAHEHPRAAGRTGLPAHSVARWLHGGSDFFARPKGRRLSRQPISPASV